MNTSPAVAPGLADALAAPQHGAGPRPLPLFLDLVARVARDDPALARRALVGLRLRQHAPRPAPPPPRPVVASANGARLLDCGGPPGAPGVILIPSLINPPSILDLDPRCSLAADLAAAGLRPLLLDWGRAEDRRALDIDGHVRDLLLPLLAAAGPSPALLGYCLGGTMALAAAALAPVSCVATLAAPWHFSSYPADARARLAALWEKAAPGAERLGYLPMEWLQAAFWAIDPARIVAKFAAFADLDPEGDEARRFLALESWANDGEPLPVPAARQLIEMMFGADAPGRGAWVIDGVRIDPAPPGAPRLHLLASGDRICPPAAAAPGPSHRADTGHVGLVVGRAARRDLHPALARFLAGA